MVGGGVDLGRTYLAESRLQQACDAGVLAARKRLGSEAALTGQIPADAGDVGNRFFNINYADGQYGTTGRTFTMALADNYAVSGTAEVTVPTTIMQIFGFASIPIDVSCEAQINFNNTDVMLVLDVTGSMNETNPGDSQSRLQTLKATVRRFYDELQTSAQAGTRIRYGFVPYSTNVNVGGSLADDWVVKQWAYQSRVLQTTTSSTKNLSYYTASSPVSGTRVSKDYSTYAATADGKGGYVCTKTQPSDAVSASYQQTNKASEYVVGPPSGTKTTVTYQRTRNGKIYSTVLNDNACTIVEDTYTNYIDTYDYVTEPKHGTTALWKYQPVTIDVSDWHTTSNGCIEERGTYDISDYTNVDLTKALDLDIDRVPTVGDPATQWRPMYPDLIYGRAVEWSGAGAFTSKTVTTNLDYIKPAGLKTAACPAAAQKLRSMTGSEIDAYMNTLKADGSTYHDIGLIWGGRLLSPTGLFAAENADVSKTSPTSRNLIFLTDGETSPLDLSYSSYGFEPVDQRRWSPSSAYSLTKTVEKRFSFVCAEIRKKNIQVWIIGFGTELNPIMKECAGEGHYFEAADAAELNTSFATIAKNLSELRIAR